MSTVSRGLPSRPHLDVPKREARELLKQFRANEPEALERVRRRHGKFRKLEEGSDATQFRLSDAQLVIAREYGFSNWAKLKERISSHSTAMLLDRAIRADDGEAVARLLRASPQLLDIPVSSGNWGPPMSHAANFGHLETIKVIASLGARDFQHAFDRALLHGHVESARWLFNHGAKLAPGIVMGCCETLNPRGLSLLVELGAPFADAQGDPLAPLALVLETYCRNPVSKHEVLNIFARQGYALPDSPMMCLHRGDADRLKHHLKRDRNLINRRFSAVEIYPPSLGCAKDGRSGMHGTPVDGTTLLHLAIEFDEQEIFDLLLGFAADIDARATADADGFGGHTPLFNAVVCQSYACGAQRDALMTRALLERGASTSVRANLRKFLDWCETPRWYEAREVTPAEWGRNFAEQSWVNPEALRLIEEAGAPGPH